MDLSWLHLDQPEGFEFGNLLADRRFHPDVQEPDDEQFYEESAQLVSKVRTIAAYSYRRSMGLPFVYPDPKLKYVANFLHMMFSMPYNQYLATEDVTRALNLILLLHADH